MTRRAACLKPTKSGMYSVDCCPRVLSRMKSEVCIRLGAHKILPYFLSYSVSQFYIYFVGKLEKNKIKIDIFYMSRVIIKRY